MFSNNSVYQEHKIPTQRKRIWRAFRVNLPAFISLWVLVIFVLISFFPFWLSPYEAQFQTGEILLPPSWDNTGKVEYFLGTDDLSRDILSRLIYAAKLTFGYGILITFFAGLIGIIIGMIAGMSKGFLSSVLNHFLDATLSIPSLLLAIIIVAIYGSNDYQVLFAVWLALVPKFIRATYTSVSDEMGKEYILAARLDGANNFYLLFHSILPNILVSLTSTFTRSASTAIIDIASLGFLGLWIQDSNPEWGSMIRESIEFVFVAPWNVALPCFAIMFSVLAINLIGDGLTQAINAGTE